MQLAGARVIPSPSDITEHGRSLLEKDPTHHGSLGIGMGEAMDLVSQSPDKKLALGCMSYYAAMHQTVVGQELVRQLELAESRPAALVGCVGGGTNLFGFASPILRRKLAGEPTPRILAVESANVPVFTRGRYEYDYADAFCFTPRVLMYTLGHQFVPPRIHAGGLRYHGKSAILSLMVHRGLVDAIAVHQETAFNAGRLFFRCEGILAAPESCHAISAVIDLVHQAQREGREEDIVFCLSGNGYLDLAGYADHFGLAGTVGGSSHGQHGSL